MPKNELTKEQKKEWAKTLYVKENLSQKEIADKVGVARQTINTWAKEWGELKLNLIAAREERIIATLKMLENLDKSIGDNPPTSKEVDARRKLTADLNALQQDLGIAEICNVSREFLEWVRATELEKAKEFSMYFDGFVKSKLR